MLLYNMLLQISIWEKSLHINKYSLLLFEWLGSIPLWGAWNFIRFANYGAHNETKSVMILRNY